MQHQRSLFPGLPRIVSAGWLLVIVGCHTSNDDIAAIQYLCGNSPPPAADAPRCGEGDPNLTPEPYVADGRGGWPPADPTDPACILKAMRVTPPDGQVLDEPLLKTEMDARAVLDTVRIQTALSSCTMVKLTSDGANNAFLASHLVLDGGTCDDPNKVGACLTCNGGGVCGKKLWIDTGVTLFMSRNADLFQKTGNCGALGVNDSSACFEFIDVKGGKPELIGDGTIDGQGGEPLVGRAYSWWQSSYALREIDGSIGNPTMVNLEKGTKAFLLYRLSLHNSAKFHVKLTSSPVEGTGAGVCATERDRGKGFIVWGITLLTPSKWFNSAGYQLTPSWARNSDGVDPGTTDIAYCGVIACNNISTGDDHIAIKGGHWVQNLTIAHNHFGTGHGMSIGSETYGTYQSSDGVMHRGVSNVHIYDLTIDADSRLVGNESHPADFNGIRIKSDESRGGLVDNIVYEDVCMRDMVNGILISTAYNPLFAGISYPDFRSLSFKNVHAVTCMALQPAVVTMEGYNQTLRPTISLDNVIFDNLNPTVGVAAEFAKINLGPGDVNFMPSGLGVDVTDSRAGGSTPKECHFPVLPAPQPPPGWKM